MYFKIVCKFVICYLLRLLRLCAYAVAFFWRCWRWLVLRTCWRRWPRGRGCVAQRTARRGRCTRRRSGVRSASAAGCPPGSRSRSRATRASPSTVTRRTHAPSRSCSASNPRSTPPRWPSATAATPACPTPRASTASGSLTRRRAARAPATASTCAPAHGTGPPSRAERVRPSRLLLSRWVPMFTS